MCGSRTLRGVTSQDPEVERVLTELIGEERSGDIMQDLCAAGREVMRRRVENSHNGEVVITAMRAAGMSWRDIHRCTGIAPSTARGWGSPPPSDGE